MNKVLLGAIILSLLTGCANMDEKGGAQKSSETNSAGQKSLAGNPLKDPNNILSKRSVYYDFDSSVVKAGYKPMVEAHAKYLATHPDARITVQGNTDDRGSSEYNLALGNRRAESVKKMMSVLGASDSQVEAVSFGKEKPRATCNDESCWKENRRSDIVYQSEQ